jgi:hypothetical protein
MSNLIKIIRGDFLKKILIMEFGLILISLVSSLSLEYRFNLKLPASIFLFSIGVTMAFLGSLLGRSSSVEGIMQSFVHRVETQKDLNNDMANADGKQFTEPVSEYSMEFVFLVSGGVALIISMPFICNAVN